MHVYKDNFDITKTYIYSVGFTSSLIKVLLTLLKPVGYRYPFLLLHRTKVYFNVSVSRFIYKGRRKKRIILADLSANLGPSTFGDLYKTDNKTGG